MSSTSSWILAACVATVVIVGILAGTYFIALKLKVQSEPEKAVLKYFDAMSAGDVDTLGTLFTPETTPSQATLSAIKKAMSLSTIKYADVKLKTLKQTKTDAEVQVLDLTISVSAGGQSITQKLSKIYSSTKIVIKLKNINGAWLIDQQGFPASPNMPSTSG